MTFDRVGLLCSFVSYPYDVDGRNLYDKVFSRFFSYHRDQWEASEQGEFGEYHESIYMSAGYRMFGSQGLLVLSLIDDYSFCTRHFHKNQIKALFKKNKEAVDESLWDFNNNVVSGITDKDDCDLLSKSKNTFLKEKERFPFVGVIRLKFNPYFLLGRNGGVNAVRDVKECVSEIAEGLCKNTSQNIISVDCFDSDELTVIAFSDNLMYLYNLLGEIRSISDKTLVQKSKNRSSLCENEGCEKHVFSSAILNFGYDVNSDLDVSALDGFRARCKIETKVGHRDSFSVFLKTLKACRIEGESLSIDDLTMNITGGCGIIFSIPVIEIQRLESLCETHETFHRDVRKVKISLVDVSGEERLFRELSVGKHIDPVDEQSNSKDEREYRISDSTVNNTRQLLKKLGVSKMVRDRIMSLFELYNKSCLDALQRFYLKELKPSLENIETDLRDLMSDKKENLSSIEQALNSEVTSLENAFSDRLCFQKGMYVPLEYSGGIHQHLTALDYAYKTICQAFSPVEKNTSFVTITGADRASSCRMLFRLNINDIVFPELFVTTVWKEVGNFHFKTLQKVPVKSSNWDCNDEVVKQEFKKQVIMVDTWHALLHDPESFDIIRRAIDDAAELSSSDGVVLIAKSMMTMETVENFFKDYIVFHFVFSRDIEKMWHFYLKVMLQTTSCYYRLNHLDKFYLAQMLLRLFMVARTSGEESAMDFVKNQKDKAFDAQIGGEWQECFSKLLVVSGNVFKVLEKYNFRAMSDRFVYVIENNIFELDHPNCRDGKSSGFYGHLDEVLEKRSEVICEMEKAFDQSKLVEFTSFDVGRFEYLVCLLASYINVSFAIDVQSKQDVRMKLLPRNNEGDVHEVMRNRSISKAGVDMSNILVDPTGGFFVPSFEIRGKYFVLRSAFYKSLWDYRFRS